MDKVIFPILKPGNWIGIEHGAIHTILCGPEDSPDVVIGYGYDTPDQLVFLMSNDIKDTDMNEMIENSYKKIDKMDVTYTPIARLDNKVLVASGEQFSSEAILSKKHMLKAHELLGSNDLFVSTPRRTCIMVTSRDTDNDILDTFSYLHDEAWGEDSYGNAPITNLLFVVQDGEIAGTINMGPNE